LRIGSDFFSDFATHADRTIYITDGCFGILGAHEIYLNAQARQLAPVRLTGNFGSELLRGASTFKPVGLSHDLLSPEFSRSVDASLEKLSDFKEHPVTFAAFKEIPWNLFGSVAAGRSQLTFRTPYLDNELVALAYRAPERLRKSSLLASRLVKATSAALSKIPTDRGFVSDNSGLEFLFRRFFAEATFKIDYYNSEGLPYFFSSLDPMLRRVSSNLGILGLHKYLPYRHWFRKELAPTVMEKLSTDRVRHAPWWKEKAPEMCARAHISGRGNYVRELNAVLTLEAIDRLFFGEVPREASADRQEMIQAVA
jgi:asparagine synthase (glutamine-hydrolysing)